MAHAPNGDAVQYQLDEALMVLVPAIIDIRNYLLDSEVIYQEDPVLLRDRLWRCLDAMTVAKDHISTAEAIRKRASRRRQAAIARERKKRGDHGQEEL
jgi:hypothetical protein